MTWNPRSFSSLLLSFSLSLSLSLSLSISWFSNDFRFLFSLSLSLCIKVPTFDTQRFFLFLLSLWILPLSLSLSEFFLSLSLFGWSWNGMNSPQERRITRVNVTGEDKKILGSNQHVPQSSWHPLSLFLSLSLSELFLSFYQ